MQTIVVILGGFAVIVYAIWQRSARARSVCLDPVQALPKWLAVIAVFLAVLIVLTPEFAALGLLGDAAFFDVLVLALSLQMQMLVVLAWRRLGSVLVRSVGWLGIPSPWSICLLAMAWCAIYSVMATVQRLAQRIFT